MDYGAPEVGTRLNFRMADKPDGTAAEALHFGGTGRYALKYLVQDHDPSIAP